MRETRRRGELTFVERRRSPTDDRYEWSPFEPDERFTGHWWDPIPYHDDNPYYVQVRLGTLEVARVELDEDVEISHYANTPALGATALEIQFLEVAADCRRMGIGRDAVSHLAARHPGRRLVAFSEEADEFWSVLGWLEFRHNEWPDLYRPLFIQLD